MSDRITTSSNPKIVKALKEAGVLPARCRSFHLILDTGHPVKILTEVYVTEDQVLAIAEALRNNPDEVSKIANNVLFKSPVSGKNVAVDL